MSKNMCATIDLNKIKLLSTIFTETRNECMIGSTSLIIMKLYLQLSSKPVIGMNLRLLQVGAAVQELVVEEHEQEKNIVVLLFGCVV